MHRVSHTVERSGGFMGRWERLPPFPYWPYQIFSKSLFPYKKTLSLTYLSLQFMLQPAQQYTMANSRHNARWVHCLHLR